VVNSYLSPVRLAEEMCALDTMSGGRSFFGLPLGIGPQYHSIAMMNPTEARERYREAHELLIRALTSNETFSWEGKFFNVPYVNLWPKPVQTPHPPIWIPSTGTAETIDLVARMRYTYLALFSPLELLKRNVGRLREAAESHGYELSPKQFVVVVTTYVAETDEKAREEAEPHILWRWQNMLHNQFHDAFPPGYMSLESLRNGPLSKGGYRNKAMASMTYDDLLAEGWVIVGSPATVRERIDELATLTGAGRYIMSADPGSMPEWMVRKSMTLFAEEVMPAFRAVSGKPIWELEHQSGYSTVSEFGARKEEVLSPALARFEDGTLTNVRPEEGRQAAERV